MTQPEKKHSAPCSNRDFDFFYDGLEAEKLLIQRCTSCAKLRSSPAPICPSCQSFSWEAVAMSGKGRIHSFVIHHAPPLPNFEMPHPIGLIDLEEGARFVAGLDGIPLSEIRIGLPVEAEFIRRDKVASVRFRRADVAKGA